MGQFSFWKQWTPDMCDWLCKLKKKFTFYMCVPNIPVKTVDGDWPNILVFQNFLEKSIHSAQLHDSVDLHHNPALVPAFPCEVSKGIRISFPQRSLHLSEDFHCFSLTVLPFLSLYRVVARQAQVPESSDTSGLVKMGIGRLRGTESPCSISHHLPSGFALLL